MSNLKTLNYEYIFNLFPLAQDRYIRKTGDYTKFNDILQRNGNNLSLI